MIKHLKAIPTKDAAGESNGRLIPIWSSAYDDYRPEQVYVTSVKPGCVKGPHLHLKRAGAFVCVHGDVSIVVRDDKGYHPILCGDKHGYKVVHVPPGLPCAIYNVGECEALVMNMPTPPWKHDDQDEHPVNDWTYMP